MGAVDPHHILVGGGVRQASRQYPWLAPNPPSKINARVFFFRWLLQARFWGLILEVFLLNFLFFLLKKKRTSHTRRVQSWHEKQNRKILNCGQLLNIIKVCYNENYNKNKTEMKIKINKIYFRSYKEHTPFKQERTIQVSKIDQTQKIK